ncbi:hypothetical protein IG631_24093 [Alternaria alternata]|nr:hypothetical protein IG631_24093 [Alternaria alternata]
MSFSTRHHRHVARFQSRPRLQRACHGYEPFLSRNLACTSYRPHRSQPSTPTLQHAEHSTAVSSLPAFSYSQVTAVNDIRAGSSTGESVLAHDRHSSLWENRTLTQVTVSTTASDQQRATPTWHHNSTSCLSRKVSR